METRKYLELFGSQLAHELTAHDKIRAFVGNHSVLIGDYAEASVRDFISRMVAPLKVSTGTILHDGNIGNPPQLDAIVWSPILAPAIFEHANFAIVPRGNAHGFLEIKSTSYSGTGNAIAETLAYEEELIDPRLEGYANALGVVCVETEPDKTLRQLVEQERAVILLKMDNGKPEANPEGIWTLVNYLIRLRLRAIKCEGFYSVNFPLISPDPPQPK